MERTGKIGGKKKKEVWEAKGSEETPGQIKQWLITSLTRKGANS